MKEDKGLFNWLVFIAIYNVDRSVRAPHWSKAHVLSEFKTSTFLSCSQMPVVFYHSVIYSLGVFIC